jgi:hypothetical protein
VGEESIVVFTSESIDTILGKGGTGEWLVSLRHARACQFAVCTRHANSRVNVPGPEPHRSAFLVGRIRDVVPSPFHDASERRFLIQFGELARVNIPDVWSGIPNPFFYASLDALGIDPSTLMWRPMS